MLVLIKEFGSFVKAVFWQWWGLMSCAFWTFAAVYGEKLNKDNVWYVKTSFWLGLFVLCLSTFLAWREQYKRVEAHNRCISGYENKAVDLTLVSYIAWDGNALAGAAPGEDAESQVITDWKKKVEDWLRTSRSQLLGISPIAFNKFLHSRRGSREEYHGVCLSLWGDLAVLNERLDNLTDIMERANVYLARVQDRPFG